MKLISKMKMRLKLKLKMQVVVKSGQVSANPFAICELLLLRNSNDQESGFIGFCVLNNSICGELLASTTDTHRGAGRKVP